MGETFGVSLRGRPGPRHPVPEGDSPGHRAEVFQHHGELHVESGGRGGLHCAHRPADGNGGVLQGHVRAGGAGLFSRRGLVYGHRPAPAARLT